MPQINRPVLWEKESERTDGGGRRETHRACDVSAKVVT